MLRLSSSNAADESEGEVAVATWDAYGPSDMAVVPTEGCIDDGPKPEGDGRMAESNGSLCAMCLFAAMQKGKESTNMHVEKALEESQRRYMETGYKELEKLTHENYEQSH